MAATNDPLNINNRLYGQISRLLDDLESADRDNMMTMPQRISALIAIGRIQTIFAGLRKNDYDGSSGSAVRKYAKAFSGSNAVGGRKPSPRQSNIIRFDSSADDDDSDAD